MISKNPFAGTDELELRRAAGESVRKVAVTLAKHLSPDDAWRLVVHGECPLFPKAVVQMTNSGGC